MEKQRNNNQQRLDTSERERDEPRLRNAKAEQTLTTFNRKNLCRKPFAIDRKLFQRNKFRIKLTAKRRKWQNKRVGPDAKSASEGYRRLLDGVAGAVGLSRTKVVSHVSLFVYPNGLSRGTPQTVHTVDICKWTRFSLLLSDESAAESRLERCSTRSRDC
jgi:hypothetical protein